MPVKFLYHTDAHTTGRTPSTRTDDYPSTIEMKLRYFFRVGHELGVDGFLNGGDTFDSPYTSSEYVTRIGRLFEEELKGKHMWGVLGNHEMIGWNPDTVKRTPIGVFKEFNDFFHILDKEPTTITGANGQKVKLSGVSSYAQLDRNIYDLDGNILQHRSRDYIVDEFDGTPEIRITHGFLSEKPILEDIPHTVIDEIYETKAAVTLTGHDHKGFPVTRLKYGLAYNPGGLSRVFASHSEMNRMPKFALVTINDDGTPTVEPVMCKVAKDGIEVMDRSLLDEKKRKEALLAEGRKTMRELFEEIDIEGVDLLKILDQYQQQKQTRPEVVKEVKRRLHI
ncbi:metallophosphoesterase [Priestia megaterium]|uniref:metallophosphoesterase n=1 Tax=Priestia megaterium TaxID=1404 RepID=UPI003D06B1A9